METLKMLFPVISGGLVVPLVSWIKAKIPTDLPIQQPIIALVLNAGLVYLLSLWLYPDISMEMLITLALGGQVSSQFIHSVKKTGQEKVIKK